MKNAVAYLRVSTSGQVDKFGLDTQRQMIQDYADRNGYRIMEWYTDKAESGAKDDRPAMSKLLYSDAVNPPIEAVIVAKWDRVARDVTLYYAYKYQFQRKNVELISASEDFSQMGPYAVILEAFVVATAEIERGMIKARTSGGRKTKAYSGGYAGGSVPYGYRNEGHKLVVSEAEADIVVSIFNLRKAGRSYQYIADYLNEYGFSSKSGKPWCKQSVYTIVQNEQVYRGMYKYGDEMEYVPGQHEPILTD